MASDFLYSDGDQGINLFAFAPHIPQQADHKAHPEPRSVFDPFEHRAVPYLDSAMHSCGCSLGCHEANVRKMHYARTGPKSHHISSQ